ncbi:unnamed protein product, partial [marine sediment metagenome]
MLKGVDCSGLLYQATNGYTPRNTSSLVSYGAPVRIAGLKVDQIIKKVEPLDIIVRRGHVVVILNKEQVIESCLHCDKYKKGLQGGVRIRRLKEVLAEIMEKRIPVDSYEDKMEDDRGVESINEIIKICDGIMIARGDMGVCLPRAQVPLIQKMIIQKCNRVGKPVITATQMLDSMIRNYVPTRAEVADVANAIIDGTDLVMLSGETAVGSYPEQAVKEMHQITLTTEASLKYEELLHIRGIVPHKTISDSVAFAARELAQLTKG